MMSCKFPIDALLLLLSDSTKPKRAWLVGAGFRGQATFARLCCWPRCYEQKKRGRSFDGRNKKKSDGAKFLLSSHLKSPSCVVSIGGQHEIESGSNSFVPHATEKVAIEIICLLNTCARCFNSSFTHSCDLLLRYLLPISDASLLLVPTSELCVVQKIRSFIITVISGFCNVQWIIHSFFYMGGTGISKVFINLN